MSDLQNGDSSDREEHSAPGSGCIRTLNNPLSEAIRDGLIDSAAPPASGRAANPDRATSSGPPGDTDESASKKMKWTSYELKIWHAERQQLSKLKKRAVYLTGPMKKSELLRAGISALSQMGDDALSAVLAEFRATAKSLKK